MEYGVIKLAELFNKKTQNHCIFVPFIKQQLMALQQVREL